MKNKWQVGEISNGMIDKTLDELSYRVTKLGKALGLNDQHILHTFKLGLPLNIYVNLVHIDDMQAILNMAKNTYGCIKRNFTRCKCHIFYSIYGSFKPDGLASGIYQKPDIPKQVTFQDSALLSGLQNDQ